MPTEIEDFNCNPNHDVIKMVWCALTALFVLLAMFLPVMVVPSLIVTLLTAVMFALEALGKLPFVSHVPYGRKSKRHREIRAFFLLKRADRRGVARSSWWRITIRGRSGETSLLPCSRLSLSCVGLSWARCARRRSFCW